MISKLGSWRKVVSVGVVTALACGITGLAIASEGLPVAQIDLNDSGVWVTNQSMQYLGRFNYSAQQLDGVSYVADMPHFDVLQEGASVFIEGSDDGSLVQVTPATLSLGIPVVLGSGSQTTLGGGMTGVYIPDQGKFWLLPVSTVASFDPSSEAFPAAVEDLPDNAVTCVGNDGTGYVIDPLSSALSIVRTTQTTTDAPQVEKVDFPGLTEKGHYSMTVVGTTPVVMDHDAATLRLGPAKSVNLVLAGGDTADAVVLQEVSDAADTVVYTTSGTVVSQPLKGGDPEVTAAPAPGGTPAAPVQLGGCAYAVWSGTGVFVRDCMGDGDDLAQIIDGIQSNQELRFRVNRGYIVLNQIDSGGVWLVSDRVIKVDDWDAAIEGQQGNEEQDSSEEVDENEKPDRTEDNHAPQAVSDQFGARAGTSVLLPVVENDIDEDGDLLTAELVGPVPSGYEVNLVYSDSIFQMNVPDTATGQVSFRYKVSDGRGGESEAGVTVTIHPDSDNAEPQAVRATTLTVTSGHRVTYNVLTDWRDPDGDTIFLTGATGPKEDMVTPVQDGSLTFQDGGQTTGVKTIQVSISDGQQTATGEILVNVLPTGNRAPVPVPDLVSGTAGVPILIKPLDNDSDPDGNTLRLTGVDGDPAKCSLVKELSQGFVTATCPDPGSVYLTYTITDGPSANQESWIRVLVTPPAASDSPPIAVPDTVLLSPGQDAYVEPLDNDINPLGYPLVLTEVDADESLPVGVSVIDYERVKITPNQDFDTPITIAYTISNGQGFATSRITVVPLEAPDKILSPTAVDDTVTVRVGDIATVGVLANDTQPNGIALRLRPDLPQVPDPDTEALVFTSGNTIRVHARQTPGTYTVLYQAEAVKGSAEPDTGRLTIYVTSDENANQAPKPKDVQVRTLVQRPVVITIPLDGIDPDGDYVTLQGVGSAPDEGLITKVTRNGFIYDPGDNTDGGDEFTYVVRDRIGLEATGRVMVGIAPASTQNRPPIAVADFAESRPGGVVTVPVTLNDSDPDSDACCYLEAGSVVSDSFTGVIRGQDVIVTAPDEPGSYWGTYEVSDEFYQKSTGVLTIRVADDVPSQKPVTADDEVSLLDALTNTSVTVSVRDNDRDPDGDVDQDKVSVDDQSVQVSSDGKVSIPIASGWQIIDYYLTDPDGLIGHGFITVPGVDRVPPQFNPSARALEVKAGESVSFALADYVIVRPGRSPRLTDAEGLTAWNGAAQAKSVTEVTFTAPADYVGRAAVSVQVTDGANLEDQTGLTAVVTIPVTVLESDRPDQQEDQKTELSVRNSSLEVEVGKSATLDLTTLVVTAPEGANLAYSAGASGVDGLTASVSGSTLTVNAAVAVPKGTQSSLTITVDDGKGQQATATVTVRVVASTLPMPQAADDQVPNANQGVAVCVPVTANDFNPYPDTPLAVVSASVETGIGAVVSVGCNGQGVSVTPGSSFLGQMVVRYTIKDATNDTSRQATGRIYLTVRGRPDPPSGLHVDQIGDRQVILSWQPPNNNGSPITGYSVTAAGYSKQCSTTTCVLDGLTNNVTYQFTVTATNEVGTSDPSLLSEKARPDVIPNPVGAPTIDFGNESISLKWAAATSSGSPVTSYDVRISPPPPNGQSETNVSGTSYVWGGLKNGDEYRVQVCPRNSAPDLCGDHVTQWSPFSIGMTPAGPPNAPAAPTWTRLVNVGNEGQVQVCWNEPYTNGAPIQEYTLKSSTGNVYTVPPAAPGSPTCKTTTLPTSQSAYTFTVAAKNKAPGYGPSSAASSGFRSVVAPGAVSNLTASDKDNSCALFFSPAPLNGASSSEVSYQWAAPGTSSGNFGTGTSGTATGLTNNGNYTIEVWARTTVQDASQDGPHSQVSCTPYGPPKKPGVTAYATSDTDNDRVEFTWSDPGRNGRDYHVEVRITSSTENQDWRPVSVSGIDAREEGWSKSYTIHARTCDVTGACSDEVTASAAAHPQPSARYWLYFNTNDCKSAQSGGYTGGCRGHVGFNKWALMDNGTYTVTCSFRQADGKTGTSTGRVTVGRVTDGTGNGYMACPTGNTGGAYINIGETFTLTIDGVTTLSGTVQSDWSVR